MFSTSLQVEMCTRQGGTQRVVVSGPIGDEGAGALEQELDGIDIRGLREIDLDLHGVTRIGSAGIGVLLATYKELTAHGAQLCLSRVPRNISELLRELNLDQIFQVR